MFGEALGAVAALQEESVPGCHGAERTLERAGLACKNERRKGSKLLLDLFQCGLIRIIRHLHDRLFPPGIGGPTLFHVTNSTYELTARSRGL
jgi:hypothetical protein